MPFRVKEMSQHYRRLSIAFPLLSALIVLVPGNPAAPQNATADDEKPAIQAVKVDDPPLLDGHLDDLCWRQAATVDLFYDVYTGGPAPERTIAYLWYDTVNIYVAFYCFDSRPGEIHAHQRKRGGNIWNDDFALFGVDTYGTGTHTYWFRVNPLGTQHETVPGGAAPKIEWRGDWSCAAKIVEDGWNCEMAIPFSILRYTSGTSEFAVAFSRKLSRTEKVYLWPDLGTTEDMHLAARWSGLKLPVIKPRPLTMLYFQADADEDATLASQGVDVKYRPRPGVTALLTLNPDFKNVEQQVEGIDFTYTQRFVGDSRPFFMEGNAPGSDLWWTRSIPDIDMGAKVYGTLGDTNFDVTHVRNFGSRDDTAIKWRQYFNDGYSYGGAALVNHHEPGIVNNTAAAAGLILGQRVGRDGRQSLNFVAYKSTTSGPGGDGSRWSIWAKHRPGNGRLTGRIQYEDVGAQFNPADAFLPLLDRDVRAVTGYLNYRKRVDKRHLREWWCGWDYWDKERHDDAPYTAGNSVSLGVYLQNNTSYSLGRGNEDRSPHKDRLWAGGAQWNTDELYRQGTASFTTGRQASGHYLFTSLAQGFYLGDGASLRLSASASRHKFPDRVEKSSLIIATFNQDLDAYRNVSARLVSRAGKHNLYASYRQSLRRGMDLYVIAGDPNAEQSRARLALKALWVY